MESLHGNAPEGNAPEPGQREQSVTAGAAFKQHELTPEAFARDMLVDVPDTTQAIVTWGRNDQPNDHLWHRGDVAERPAWLASKGEKRKPAYFTPAAYAPDKVERHKGRKAAHVVAVQSVWVDIEGSPAKYAKDGGPEAGYANAREATQAAGQFMRATGLVPTHIVTTGSGGLHLYYRFQTPIPLEQWRAFAQGFVALAARVAFKIDAQCTTDAARIMRMPGSLHQTTGHLVQVYRWRGDDYAPEEFAMAVGVEAGAYSDKPPAGAADDASANDEATGSTHLQYSYPKAAERCGAMRQAAARNGRDTPYPVWILALVTAKNAIEGEAYAHEISSEHEGYDEAETAKKIASLGDAPAACDAWAKAGGPGGPCDTCEWRGKIKAPTVLGRIVDTSTPGVATDDAPAPDADAPGWLRELNSRYALVRVGSKIIVADFRTPYVGAQGVTYGMGYLDIAALRTRHAGQFAPSAKPGEKQRALAEAWLAHPQRRQYEGVVFAPGEPTPPSILNLWQGFAVTPVAGIVSLWLRLLDALVPDPATRAYVLLWLAWKVQNPGGVPDTVLVLTGGKGTGKNSLFTPLLTAFGRHAMLADDPELIAGRFTHHLMYLALGVLDEAVFVGDPKQADRIKSRITAHHMHYEQKGFDPVQGINRCAYVMLTNHAHAWQATTDERRAVVIEVGESLRGDHDFWREYHAWANGPGAAALLHYLQGVDVSAFNPRAIPKTEALARQVELTALRDPQVSWWQEVLEAGAIEWSEGGFPRRIEFSETEETEVPREGLQRCYERSAGARGRQPLAWGVAAKRLRDWVGAQDVRRREGGKRIWAYILPPLPALREQFAKTTGVRVE